MHDGDSARLRSVRQGLTCPVCAYSLRGLRSRNHVVVCPECGFRMNTRRLDRPWRHRSWYVTTEFGVLLLPTAVLALGGLLCWMLLRALNVDVNSPLWAFGLLAGALSLVIVGWAGTLAYVGVRLSAAWAIFGALALHLVALCYVLALVLLPVGLLYAGGAVVMRDWIELAALLAGSVGAIGVLAAARAVEHWIGRRCVQHEQWRRTRTASDASPVALRSR